MLYFLAAHAGNFIITLGSFFGDALSLQFFIVAVMLSIGIFPQLYFSAVLHLITSVVPSVQLPDVSAFQTTITLMAEIGTYSFMFLCLLILVFLIRNILVRNRTMIINTTWGCGYIVSRHSKMQIYRKIFFEDTQVLSWDLL